MGAHRRDTRSCTPFVIPANAGIQYGAQRRPLVVSLSNHYNQ